MPDKKPAKRKYLSHILRFSVAAAAIYLAFRGKDPTKVINDLSELNLWTIAAAFALYAMAQLIFAFRWNMLLRVQSIKIGYWPAVRLHFLGLFYNNCLPGAVGGDMLRIWYVTKHTDKKLEAGLSVFVDRCIGLTGMLIMAFFCYWFIPAEGQTGRFAFPYKLDSMGRLTRYWPILAAVTAVLLIAFAAFVATPKGRSLLQQAITLIRQHGLAILRKLHAAVVVYYNRKLAVVAALLLTILLQSTCVAAIWLIGRKIGIDAPAKYYFIFFPISWLLGVLPISVGGAGVMELWLTDIFIRVCRVPQERALALALSQRLLWLFGSLPGVIIHLRGAHLPKDFSVDYEKPPN